MVRLVLAVSPLFVALWLASCYASIAVPTAEPAASDPTPETPEPAPRFDAAAPISLRDPAAEKAPPSAAVNPPAAADLESSDPAVRDRAFRQAVASGQVVRSRNNDQGLRVSGYPASPAPGGQILLLIETPSPCPAARAEIAGPDGDGLMTVALTPDCGETEWPKDRHGLPAASRAVVTIPVPAMPASGLRVVSSRGVELYSAGR
jgi:hypothetical protein